MRWLEGTAAALDENKDYLTQLDSLIGDADHGINMHRGFKKVLERLPAWLTPTSATSSRRPA